MLSEYDKATLTNEDLERQFLAGMLRHSEYGKLSQDFDPDDLFKTAHKNFWRAFQAINSRGLDITPMGVLEWLQSENVLQASGGKSYVEQIGLWACHIKTRDDWREVADIIQNLASRRRMLQAGSQLIEIAKTAHYAADAYIEARKVLASAEKGVAAQSWAMADGSIATMDLSTVYRKNGICTGIPTLDKKVLKNLGGLPTGEYSVVEALRGVGKTYFALQVARAEALRGGKVLFVTLEMPPQKLVGRFMNLECGMEEPPMTGDLYDDPTEQWEAAWESIKDLPIELIKAPYRVPSNDFRMSILRRCESRKYRAVVVDYVQCIGNEQYLFERADGAADAMKMLAEGLGEDTALIVLSQVTEKDGKATSRGGQELENHAAFVLQLEKAGDDDFDPSDPKYDLKVTKNRHGRYEGATIQVGRDKTGALVEL